MNCKMLVTDLDGTLLRDQTKDVSSSMKNALERLLELGHKVVFSSGRPLNSILEVIDTLRLPSQKGLYISAFNGALLYDCESCQSLYERRVPMDAVSYITAQAKLCGIHCHTYSDTHIISPADTPELRDYCRHIHLPFHISDPVTDALSEEPFKLIAIHLTDKSVLQRFRESLRPWSDRRITTLFSSNILLELFSPEAGKGNSLLELCRLLGISPSDSMAAGDADNDLSMIEAAGYGVAMQNASSSVKEKADYITAYSNNEDGLLFPIQSFFAI